MFSDKDNSPENSTEEPPRKEQGSGYNLIIGLIGGFIVSTILAAIMFAIIFWWISGAKN